LCAPNVNVPDEVDTGVLFLMVIVNATS